MMATPGTTLVIDGQAVGVEAPELILRQEDDRVLADLFAETPDGTSGLVLDGVPLPDVPSPEQALGRRFTLTIEEHPELADGAVTLADSAMVIDEITIELGLVSAGAAPVRVEGRASIWGGRTGIPFSATLDCGVEICATT